VLEGFADGLLILSQDGTCLYQNQKGKSFCRALHGHSLPPAEEIPPCLQAMCSHLREGRDLFPDHGLVLTQDFDFTSTVDCCLRARVQWLNWPDSPDTYFLVLLEDQTRAARTSALLEAIQYDLTPRERDVWVLRRTNHSYDDIALALYITVNTVKRHLKSIYAKRKQVLDDLVN
jgi:DNA-binding CsgD family transcriptional regulator